MANQWLVTPELTRLDSIVQHYYGDLTMFDAVLKANAHIENVTLHVGTVIELPDKTVNVSEEVLW